MLVGCMCVASGYDDKQKRLRLCPYPPPSPIITPNPHTGGDKVPVHGPRLDGRDEREEEAAVRQGGVAVVYHVTSWRVIVLGSG